MIHYNVKDWFHRKYVYYSEMLLHRMTIIRRFDRVFEQSLTKISINIVVDFKLIISEVK